MGPERRLSLLGGHLGGCSTTPSRFPIPGLAGGSGRSAHRVAVIGGDGIGPEVTAVALDVLRAAGAQLETTEFRLGGFRYLEDGVVLPDETLAELRGGHTPGHLSPV